MNYDEASSKALNNCCDIDVLLDPESGHVQFEMKFKPEWLPADNSPAVVWRRFYCRDAVNELARQGIVVDNPHHIGYIDNLHGDSNITYTFTVPAPKPKVEKKGEPVKKTSVKKKATPKKD